MGKYFGTDGFRGEAGVTLLAEHAYKIGRYLGYHYQKDKKPGERVKVVIGKDTRRSSYMFEYAVAAGLTASGADAYLLHVTTTPSVCFICNADDFDCGIMISASHNPFYDNGIKLVNSHGEKFSDKDIESIEKYIDGDLKSLGIEGDDLPYAKGGEIGETVDYVAGRNRYIGYLISLSKRSFKPFRVGLDCANGASWAIAKSVFEALGAKVYVMGDEPNGININLGVGSTHIEGLCEFVKEKKLDVAFAFDGDADRCIAVDNEGNIINGDHILYILACKMKKEGKLANNTVVTTVMSNIGLYKALDKEQIDYVQVTVGDRFVYENMCETGNCLGGEQSGHIIMSKYATTGDGILTAIKVMEAIIGSGKTLKELASNVKMYPQVLINVKTRDKKAITENPRVLKELEEVKKELDGTGRILLRESGTEPLVRVMAECKDIPTCEKSVNRIVKIILEEGLGIL